MSAIEAAKELIENNEIVRKVQRIRELQDSLKVTPIKKSDDILSEIAYVQHVQAIPDIKTAYYMVGKALTHNEYDTMTKLSDYIQEYIRYAKLENEVDEHNAVITEEIEKLKKELGIR